MPIGMRSMPGQGASTRLPAAAKVYSHPIVVELIERNMKKPQDSEIGSENDFFWRHGYMIVRNAFTAEEMSIAKEAITTNPAMNASVERIREKTSDGKHPAFETIYVWNDTSGDDLFAKFTRNEQIFNRIGYFFDDQPYVYHNKIALKYPGIPGFLYHQDYFYWYGMGCLYPDMATVSIAVDPSTRENGCLRVIDGSHKVGRIDHVFDAERDDTGADRERLEMIKSRCEEVFIELDMGDFVIFHCNTLHGSDDNTSNKSRIALLGCYNIKHNDPYAATFAGHPFYQEQTPITERVTRADLGKMPNFGLRFTGPS
jgi:ectoine hydroxylase